MNPTRAIAAKVALQKQRARVLEKLERALGPESPTPLPQGDPFRWVITVMLSAQARDAQVERTLKNLFEVASTPEAVVELGVERCEHWLKPLGLYRPKARYLVEIARLWPQLSVTPDFWSPSGLMRLPGVGRKTAHLVLSLRFGLPFLAVDTHVFRIAHRLGWSQGKTPTAVEQDLAQQIPENWMARLNGLWVRHGRRFCRARFPKCRDCPIMEDCDWGLKQAEA